MLGPTKAPVSRTVLDDARGQRRPYIRQLFQLLARRRVDVDERLAPPRRITGDGRRILTGSARGAAWQPDAGDLRCGEQRDSQCEQQSTLNRLGELRFQLGLASLREGVAKDAALLCKMLEV